MNKEKAGPTYLVIQGSWKSNDVAKRSLLDGEVVGVYETYQNAITEMRNVANRFESNVREEPQSFRAGMIVAMAQVVFSRVVEHAVTHTEVDYLQI